jgi:exodeoxyribonuclease V alpha subunit
MVSELIVISVQVKAVSFKGSGAIFTGRIVDDSGVQSGEEFVVRCPGNILYPRQEVFKGEVWTLSGRKETFRGHAQLGAVSAFLKRPSGENIISAIAFNPKFGGIGEKKARDLWAAFGEGLYDLLDSDVSDLTALHQILSPEAAARLQRIWKDEYSSSLYRWLDEYQIPKALSRRLQEHYGREARAEIERDPYRVLAFGQPWSSVDGIARRLGVAEDDPRRLHAAVAEVLYQHFAKGHTGILTEELAICVTRLLGSKAGRDGLAYSALKHTYSDGAFVRNGDMCQAAGIYLMEAFVADRFCRMTAASKCLQASLHELTVDQTVDHYEKTEHPLSREQKETVHLALKSSLCVITGGAGVGKTSVLRCIYNAIEAAGGSILQMALSGRAARRMEEATERPSRTIAGFLTHIQQEELNKVTHAVIDEASMLDVVSAFQILRKLPEHIKLILVGDPYQLPPIGAGLTFHVLADASGIPTARLTKVYRQSSESGIPAVSQSIRRGEWPSIPEYRGRETGVFCLQAGTNEIGERLVLVYEDLNGADDPEEVQILSPIKANNPHGVVGINKAFHARYTEGENVVLVSSSTGDLMDSGFRQGDRIMVTQNQWNRQLFNGSLGRIVEAFRKPIALDEDRPIVAKAVIDGRDILLAQDDLDWIVHSYSISVHKSQGSQFKRVIVPICRSRLLDRTLIYTAVTRGIHQVVLLGDMSAAKSAVEELPRAWLRQIGFSTIMNNRMRMRQQSAS